MEQDIEIKKDGLGYVAVRADFVNYIDSDSGVGDTPFEALEALLETETNG